VTTSDDRTGWASISGRPLFGTATRAAVDRAVPIEKQRRECFWVEALVRRLDEPGLVGAHVLPSPDDSHHKDDIVISTGGDACIGVQVTELTSELERGRRSQASKYVNEVLRCFEEKRITSDRKLVVMCLPPTNLPRRYFLPSPEEIANVTESFIAGEQAKQIHDLDSARLAFSWVEEGDILVPSVGQIGFDCDLGELPRTIETYCDAASSVASKKANSASPWLLVWSTSFWKDKHWLQTEVLSHMEVAFRESTFERVFFAESMDCQDAFEANLEVHCIKG
jgi:hypothetical protein